MNRIICAAIALLFAAGGVTAQDDEPAPVDADFEITGPVQLSGDVALDAELAGVLLHPAEDSAFELSVQDARLRLINVPYRVVETRDGSAVGAKSVYVGGQAQLVWERSWTGTVALDQPGGSESTIRILPGPDGFSHAFYDNVRLGPPTWFPTPAVDDHAALPSASLNPVASGRIAPDGVYAAASDSDASLAGAMRVLLYGGDFHTTGKRTEEVATGHILNSTVTDPLGQAGSSQYDRLVLLIDVVDGEVNVWKGGGQLELLVRHLSGWVSGEMALHGVHGSLTADEEHVGGYALAQLMGNLTMDADYDATSTWAVVGEASYVALDADPVFGSQFGSRGPGLAEAAAVSLLVVAAYAVVSFLRKGVVWRWVEAWKVKAWLLAPLAARLTDKDILNNRRRRTIADILNSAGVVPLQWIRQQASAVMDISGESIRRHVDAMCRTGALARVQKGRRVFVGPNRGVYATREAQVAGALTFDDAGFQIGFAFCAEPESSQREVVNRVNGRLAHPLTRIAIGNRIEDFAGYRDEPFSQATASDACRTIRLIRKKRDGRHVRYSPTEVLRSVITDRLSPRPFEQNISQSSVPASAKSSRHEP